MGSNLNTHDLKSLFVIVDAMTDKVIDRAGSRVMYDTKEEALSNIIAKFISGQHKDGLYVREVYVSVKRK